MPLESLGVHELWHVFKSKDKYLYVSMCERVVANCLYEVHFYKAHVSRETLFKEEFMFIDSNAQPHSYAVVVDRPDHDLNDLIRIWAEQQLQIEYSEKPSKEKAQYIYAQITKLNERNAEAGIVHGLLRPSSYMIDLRTYQVSLSSYSLATKVGDEGCR